MSCFCSLLGWPICVAKEHPRPCPWCILLRLPHFTDSWRRSSGEIWCKMGTGRVCLPVICQYSADTYCCSSQFHTSRYSPHSLWHRIGALYLSIMHNMHSSAYMHSLDTLIQYKIVNFIGRLLEC